MVLAWWWYHWRVLDLEQQTHIATARCKLCLQALVELTAGAAGKESAGAVWHAVSALRI
jgi:hypothetical protein